LPEYRGIPLKWVLPASYHVGAKPLIIKYLQWFPLKVIGLCITWPETCSITGVRLIEALKGHRQPT
jgi:hypothetical protein